jgi:hypothetical protein
MQEFLSSDFTLDVVQGKGGVDEIASFTFDLASAT